MNTILVSLPAHPTISLRRHVLKGMLLLSLFLWAGCNRQTGASSGKARGGPYQGPDQPREEVDAFRFKVRNYYNRSSFQALEDAMAEIRSGPEVFGTGSSRLYQFYDALQCSSSEPESRWQQHERIHEAWEKAFPQSITARVAHADFLTAYAWHARGGGFANTVSEDGWKVFRERLKAAKEILDAARDMTPPCPMWWHVEMTLALGQGWKRQEESRVLADAKHAFPQFWAFDVQNAYYLLPRWYGKEGDWEKSAAAEMERPEGLGAEGYARVVYSLISFYDNIFRDSHASWPITKEGFEQIRKKYPASLQNLTSYYQLACLAGDRPVAQQLLKELDGYVEDEWGQNYEPFRTWTLTGQPSGGLTILRPR